MVIRREGESCDVEEEEHEEEHVCARLSNIEARKKNEIYNKGETRV